MLASAVLISAFVSLTLTPMLNAKLVRKNSKHKHSRFYEITEPFFQKLSETYERSLTAFMRKKWWAFIIIIISVVLTIVTYMAIPAELAPLDDRSWFRMAVTAPEGSSYEYTDDYMLKLTDFVNDSIPEKKVMLTVTAPGFTGSGAVNTGFVRLVFGPPDERKRSQQEIADYLMKATKKFPEAKIFVIHEQTISAGGTRGLPVQFIIKCNDFEKLKASLPKFMEEASKNSTFQVTDVNLKFTRPELKIIPDTLKAKQLQVSNIDLAQTLQLALSGQRFAFFTMNEREYQVIGQLSRENRDDPLDLSSIYIRNAEGKMIQLDNLVKTAEESSTPQRYRYNTEMSATISAGLAPGKTLEEGIVAMREIKEKVLDDTFTTALSGPSRDFEESSSNFLFTLILAISLIYLILAAQFESFRDPVIILATILLGFSGALISLWYFNQTWNLFSQIGLIMLIGLVTKNGILIVEFTNKLRERGKTKAEAIIEGASMRLRPILMTSLATVLGALPIALALGAGAKSRMGMGIVIIGGILVALIFTLYVIPALYSYISKKDFKHAEK